MSLQCRYLCKFPSVLIGRSWITGICTKWRWWYSMGARSCFRWKLHPSSQAWPLLSTSNRGETTIAKCGNYVDLVWYDDVIKWKIFRVTGPSCGKPPVTGGFPSQRPVTRSLDVFFALCLYKRLSKNWDAGDLRRNRTHYDVNVMEKRVLRWRVPSTCRPSVERW